MKLSCTQENLSKGLQLIFGLAGKHPNLPILNNVLLQADKEGLTLVTTNLEIGIKSKVRGKIEEAGSFTVNAKLLGDFVHSLKRENISIELQENTLVIQGENHTTKIKGESANDFPLIPEISPETTIVIATAILRDGLNQVLFAASSDEGRPELNAVFFSFIEDKLTLVATDSYRLAEKHLALIKGSDKEQKLIIPLKTVQQLAKILAEDNETEETIIMVNDNQIKVVIGPTEVISRIVVGHYPDYQQIIPTSFTSTISFQVSSLAPTIKTTALFCQPGINDVRVSYVPDTKEIQLRAQNSMSGDNISRVQADVDGKAGEIVFNYRYLLDGINNLNNDKGKIKLNDSSGPALMSPESDTSFRYLIMPIKQ
ncbi:MAG: DNA polymerase III subunit beta [Candidatus Komeilibacteria bacterium]